MKQRERQKEGMLSRSKLALRVFHTSCKAAFVIFVNLSGTSGTTKLRACQGPAIGLNQRERISQILARAQYRPVHRRKASHTWKTRLKPVVLNTCMLSHALSRRSKRKTPHSWFWSRWGKWRNVPATPVQFRNKSIYSKKIKNKKT